METQTRLSRHNKFISAENIVGRRDGEYTNNILRRNKFFMTA